MNKSNKENGKDERDSRVAIAIEGRGSINNEGVLLLLSIKKGEFKSVCSPSLFNSRTFLVSGKNNFI